jgi:hypothetical protein
MTVLRRLPACFALLMLGALSLRLGFPFLLAVPLTILLVVLIFVPQLWVQIGLAVLVALGSLGWLAMLVVRVQERLAFGGPWLRLAIILGAVAIFTGWSAWLLKKPHGEGA